MKLFSLINFNVEFQALKKLFSRPSSTQILSQVTMVILATIQI